MNWPALGINLLVSAAAVLALMLITFTWGRSRQRHRVVDVAWGLGFVTVAVVTYVLSASHGDDGRRLLVTALAVIWGLRLSGHIARRGWGHGEDPRYENLLSRAGSSRRAQDAYALRMVYLLQAALVCLVSLPIQVAQYVSGPLGPVALAGAALWAVGFGFETVGDAQLQRFKADPDNRGRIMDRGLWRYTRHPNYFGDFCVWWGLFLIAAENWAALVALPSPLVMSYLLTRGSGKRLLEKQMADRPGYADYAARTSGFFPLPPRSKS